MDRGDDQLWNYIREVLRRSRVDAAFRALALENAGRAIAEVAGGRLLVGAQIQFVDNSGPVKTIPLPEFSGSSDELSEAELEQIAGGGSTPAP